MAALGELLFYVVTQEPRTATGAPGDGEGYEAWGVPVAAVGGAIGKCLEDAEYEGVRHYAAKTVENVLAQAGPSHPLMQVLVTPELALGLFNLAR